MFDRGTIYLVGTVCLVFGGVSVLVSLPVVIVGIAHIAATTGTIAAGLDVLVHAAPRISTLHGPRARLSLGLLGLGFGCWLLGVGLLLQGRIERYEKGDV